MSNKRLSGVFTALTAIIFAAFPVVSLAQADYPSKPVKIIVPFPPGGTSDVMARMVGGALSKEFNQSFVIENIGGGGGTIGVARAAKLPADGYNLILTGVGSNAVAHGLDPKLPYDSIKDLVNISQIHSGPNVLVVNPNTPYKTMKDVVDFARKNPGKLDYGYTHAASGHMAMELFKQEGKMFITGIPYRGGGPMMNDILAGTIPMMFINQDAALPHVKAGKLRALAVTSAKRNPLYPDVPTVAEAGLAGFEALSWSGLSTQKGTPQPIVDKLETAMKKVMASAEIKQRMESVGFVVPAQGSAPYTKFVDDEIKRWTKVIQTAGIVSQ